MSNLTYKLYYRRNLPHFQLGEAIIAVAFNLAFSLPQRVISDIKAAKNDYERIAGTLHGTELVNYRKEMHKRCFDDFDTFIGTYNHSEKWLMNEQAANIVAETINHWNTKRYDLLAYCIMPNHVHIMISPLKREDNSFYTLSDILHTIKRYTARKCNQVLQQGGRFWHHESYDHAVRDEEDFYYQLCYILENPVKAKLVKRWDEWKFTYLKEGICL
jgi:REP element-mobilizing transposase RayT